MKKIYAAILICLALLLANCSQTPKKVSPSPEQTPETDKVQFTPLKLVYELNNAGPANGLKVTYWFEKQQQCSNRDALVGIAKFEGKEDNSNAMYAKFTVYSDNGEMALSEMGNEEKLAFDDMMPSYNYFNLPFTMSEIFIYAGKNLNNEEFWTATAPTVLKDVDSGMSVTNYSAVRQEQDSTGIAPCQKFKLIAKGTNVDGYYNVCLSKELGFRLPFTVYFTFSSQNGPNLRLLGYANESSGIPWVPQCLEAVKCTYVPMMSGDQRIACQFGKGEVDTVQDEKGCIKEYRCLTQTQIAEEAIKRVQRPECSVNAVVKSKLIECRKNSRPNFDTTQYDEGGCLVDITCRA